jgi:hypothetical protein
MQGPLDDAAAAQQGDPSYRPTPVQQAAIHDLLALVDEYTSQAYGSFWFEVKHEPSKPPKPPKPSAPKPTVTAPSQAWDSVPDAADVDAENDDPFRGINTTEFAAFNRINFHDHERAGAGMDIDYYHLGDLLLLSGSVTLDEQVTAMEKAGATRGRIHVDARGSLTSQGRVTVYGCTDRDGFKKQFRQFSKKSIKFV